MTILLFFVVLAVLILSHEFGHFIAAKKAGVRVEEFGLGFPPRLVGWRWGETIYSLNLIPFGGFVKIFGETPDAESEAGPERARSLSHKPAWVQAVVLAAGVAFNIVLAWLLISVGFMFGLPTPESLATPSRPVENVRLLITSVLPNSPAAEAGLKPGDEIVGFDQPAEVQSFIQSQGTGEFTFTYRRGGEEHRTELAAEPDVAGDVPAIGIAMDRIGLLQLGPLAALGEGALTTVRLTGIIAVALGQFIYQAFAGQADLGTVTGPVGLVGLVGDASALGFVYLLSFTALISIHLAIINLVPFPALDGGRLLFLLIEKIKGSSIKPAVANTLNLAGFALLLLFMLVVTYHDIVKLL